MDDQQKTSVNSNYGKTYREKHGAKNKLNRLSKQIPLSKEKYQGIEGIDYVECKVCGLRAKSIRNHLHLHNMSNDEYKTKFGVDRLMVEGIGHKSGKDNPAFQHGGRLSPFSEKFLHGYNEDVHKAACLKGGMNGPRRIEYWLKKTGGNVDEAKKLLFGHQRNFSIDQCIEKHGEVEGRAIWEERQRKWQYTLNLKSDEQKADINLRRIINRKHSTSSVSSSEKELVLNLRKHVDVTTQYRIKNPVSNYHCYYDIQFNKKIIEFHGDYWHANPSMYHSKYYHSQIKKTAEDIWARDQAKTKLAIESGFEVMVVWESEYIKNKEGVIAECLKFLIK